MELNWLDKAYKKMKSKDKLDRMCVKDKQGNLSPMYKQNLIEIIMNLTDKYSLEQLQEHNTSILTAIVEEETKSLKQ